MKIADAIHDPELFRPFLADKSDRLDSWHNWLGVLKVMYGLPIASHRHEFIKSVTGRDPLKLPKAGFSETLLCTGRRSGKSRASAVISMYESAIAGHHTKLASGEIGICAVLAPTKKQARIIRNYIRAGFKTPLLEREVAAETKEGFDLNNGIKIEILTGDFRSARGHTLIAAVVDEIAFFGLDDDAKVKSDTELIRAIRPALATTNGKLICITTPYARKGWTWKVFQKNFGNDNGRILVVNCPSRSLNPLLSPATVQAALDEDMAAAKSEYLGEFRDDVAEFLPREVIERCVVKDRRELLPDASRTMVGFCDVSGGRNDSSVLALAFKNANKKVVLAKLKVYKPPHSPAECIADMANELRRFGLNRVTGDNYSANFCSDAFRSQGIIYTKCDKPCSQLYAELLPMLSSGAIELLDHDQLLKELCSLERRTRSGGRDLISHPNHVGAHDDAANACAGAAVMASTKIWRVGALFDHSAAERRL